jgi:ribonuclease HI
MAKKKVAYVVIKGRKPGIYKTWAECQKQVAGFSGAVFKGYETMDEAEAAYGGGFGASTGGGASMGAPDLSSDCFDSSIDALYYTDGSFTKTGGFSFAVYEIIPDGKRTVYYRGYSSSREEAQYRNVAGEVFGSSFAMARAKKMGFSKIEIRYDYEGVEHWCTGAWQAKNPMTQKYRDFFKASIVGDIEVVFTHVPGHTSVDGNELCDKYAGLKTGKYDEADLVEFDGLVDEAVDLGSED